jgi:hypothetical protein
MSVSNYVIYTAGEKVMAEMRDDDAISNSVWCRPVDATSPGAGLNINPAAEDYVVGAAVNLTGKFVAPVRNISNPDFIENCPDLIALMNQLPWCALEAETIFAPEPEV